MGSKRPAAGRIITRTPQPPPSLNTSTTRSRSTSSHVATTPSRAANPSNNDASPRIASCKPATTASEPATDEDDGPAEESSSESWMWESEATLASMDKQIQDAAKRNQKHQTRCSSMREYMAGKEERMDSLRGTYATLNRELAELELLSGEGDLDPTALDELFLSIPAHERALIADESS